MEPNTSPSPASASAARIARWLDLMRSSDKLLLAGLRRKIGPDGDLDEAYREWYADQMRAHDLIVERVVRGLSDVKEESENAR